MPEKKANGKADAPQKPNVDAWVEREDDHKIKALQNASREFDENDEFTVHTLEAVYGQESSFGQTRGKRGTKNAAGDFQMEKATAKRYGLTVSDTNDQRFDVDSASHATAKQIKELDELFTKKRNLGSNIYTSAIADASERKIFVIAAVNAGEGRIARAQALAKKAGKDPSKWEDVKDFLKQAGATDEKVNEILDYIEKVQEYEKQFSEKSKASEKYKDKDSTDIKPSSRHGHWITKNGRPIFIERTK